MYQHGKRTSRPKSKGTFFMSLALAAVAIMIAAYIVHKDVADSTDPKSTVPIVTNVSEGSDENKLKIKENLFSFELPADWKLQEKRSDESANFYIWVATKKGANDRRLTLHVDKMPANHKLVKLQPVTPNGSKFMLGNLSDDCVNFAGATNRKGNAEFPAKWENVNFMCDPIVNNQTIGTGTENGGIKTTLGRHSFFFFYEDHNIHPDDRIFIEALRSFVAN